MTYTAAAYDTTALKVGTENANFKCKIKQDYTDWMQVRHTPATPTAWHTANDNLDGTATVYGDPTNAAAEWNLVFSDIPFKSYLFIYGDKSNWAEVSKANFDAAKISTNPLAITSSATFTSLDNSAF